MRCGHAVVMWRPARRYHHLHTDTPLDPHSPYEGFWWSHMGWLLNNGVRAPSHSRLYRDARMQGDLQCGLASSAPALCARCVLSLTCTIASHWR